MGTLTTSEIGSIVYNLIENIPTGISGLLVNGTLPEQSIFQIENYTGDNISTSAIDEKYQPVCMNLTISQVLGQMESQGLGNQSLKLGELSINKGIATGNSENFKTLAYNQLKDIPKNINYYQTWA